MSEYQRYEFMTVDKPLSRAQLGEVEDLSSHIEANSTSAFIEYYWGDFKHDPIKVLYRYFDGFLYWANWGAPQFALRFPHGILPDDLLSNYYCGGKVTFTQHADYDVLAFNFGELEAPDEWIEYTLVDLIPLREELINGDPRALYIGWLASQALLDDDDYYEEDEDEEWEEDEDNDEEWEEEEDEDEEWEEDEDNNNNKQDKEDQQDQHKDAEVPPNFSKLTPAQLALADLLQVPQELLAAAAQHSKNAPQQTDGNNFEAWVELLPQERRSDYLIRLARNEPGLHLRLVKELRTVGQSGTQNKAATGEAVPYTTLVAESRGIKVRLDNEERERLQRERHQRLQQIQEHQSDYWFRADQAAIKKTSSGYDEATRILEELREAATYFEQTGEFQQRIRSWLLPHLRRPALIQRLRTRKFPLPES